MVTNYRRYIYIGLGGIAAPITPDLTVNLNQETVCVCVCVFVCVCVCWLGMA